MIPQNYPLTVIQYEIVDHVDGNPILRQTSNRFAVIGWTGDVGVPGDMTPVLVPFNKMVDSSEAVLIPDPDLVYEFEDWE